MRARIVSLAVLVTSSSLIGWGILVGIVDVGSAILSTGGILICGSIYFAILSEHRDACSNYIVYLMFALGTIFILFVLTHLPIPVVIEYVSPYEELTRRLASFFLIIWVCALLIVMEYKILPSIQYMWEELQKYRSS